MFKLNKYFKIYINKKLLNNLLNYFNNLKFNYKNN